MKLVDADIEEKMEECPTVSKMLNIIICLELAEGYLYSSKELLKLQFAALA